MDKSIKISIIIPIFNCDKYLIDCLNSILNQSLDLEEFEVIMVNDGSNDNSQTIINEFEKNYKNFVSINQTHLGVGKSRNKGLSLASGDYVYFMDADDWLLQGGMRILIDKYIRPNNYPDVITFNSRTVDKYYKHNSWNYINENKKTYDGTLNEFAVSRGISNSAWNCLISKKLLLQTGIKFTSHKIAEDMLFMINLFNLQNPSIIATNLNFYRYRVHKTSALNSNNRDYLKEIFFDLNDIIIKLEEYKINSFIPSCVLDNKINLCRRWAFTRLCSGGFNYKVIKNLIKNSNIKEVALFDRYDKINWLITFFLKYPFLTFMFSIFYKNLFIPLIKPFIKRN